MSDEIKKTGDETAPDDDGAKSSRRAVLWGAAIATVAIVALPFVTGATDWLQFEPDIVFALILGMIGTAFTTIYLMSLVFRSARTGVDDQLNYREMVKTSARETVDRDSPDSGAPEPREED